MARAVSKSTQQSVHNLDEKSLAVKQLEVTTDTTAYAVGDVILPAEKLGDVTLRAASGAMLTNLSVADVDEVSPGLDFHFFSSEVSVGSGNAAFTVTDSDAEHYCGKSTVTSADYVDEGAFTFAAEDSLSLAIVSGGENSDVWVVITATAAVTFTSTAGLYVNLYFLRF